MKMNTANSTPAYGTKKHKVNLTDLRLNRSGTVGTEPVSIGGKRYTQVKFGKLGSVHIPSKNK